MMLTITAVSDDRVWYAKSIGRQYKIEYPTDRGFIVVDNDGYKNIVFFDDCKINESQ